MGLRIFAIALAAATTLLALVRFALPVSADGCLPDPYRLLGSSPAPSTSSATFPPVSNGKFPNSTLSTNETPPQAQAVMTDGTFVSPNSAFVVSIAPVAAPAPTPSDTVIDGNAYRFRAITSSGAQLEPVDSQHGITIFLRGTGSNPARTIERLDGTAWTALKTFDAGCGNTFEADTSMLGVFALVMPAKAPGGGGIIATPLIVALVVVVVATALTMVVLNRARPQS